jgi:uncharacterized membrane protein
MYRVSATGLLCLALVLAGGPAVLAQDQEPSQTAGQASGQEAGAAGAQSQAAAAEQAREPETGPDGQPGGRHQAHKAMMARMHGKGMMSGKDGKGGKGGEGKMPGKGGKGGKGDGKGRCAKKRQCPRGPGGGPLAGGGLMKLMMGHLAMAAPDAAALGPMGPFGRGLSRRWDLSGLELGPEQRAELRELAYRHLKRLHELKAQRNALRLEAVYLLGAEKLDAQRLERVYGDLGRAQAQLLANSRSYLDGLASLSSPEQLSGLQP